MFCGNCGKQISDVSRFCIHCGCAVPAGQASQRPSQTNPTPSGQAGDNAYPTEANASHQARDNAYPTEANASRQAGDNAYPTGANASHQARDNAYPTVSGTSYPSGTDASPAPPYPTEAGAPYPGASPTQGQPGAWSQQQNGYYPYPPIPPQGTAGAVPHANGRAKLIAALAAAAVFVVVIAAAVYGLLLKSGKPEDTVAELEKALNKLDTEAMMDCFDEPTQQVITGSMGLAGSLSGLDMEALSGLASGLGGWMAEAGLMPKFTLNVLDVSYSGNDACIVTVRMIASYGGETETETTQLPMKKEGRKWLISMGAFSGLGELDGLF